MIQRQHRSLTYLDLPPAEPVPVPLVIMLHGYGSNEKDLVQLAPALPGKFRYISARAPMTMDYGMYGWFPIAFTPDGITVDYEAAKRALQQFAGFVRDIIGECRPAGGRVFLMGFSQGAVMSYLTAFMHPELLHGVIALSGQLPERTVPPEACLPALRKLPFLVMHGIYDDVLPVAKGRAAHAWLQGHVDDLTYREYPVAHQISESGVMLISSWLEARRPGECLPS
jgi:phospholipase/carboxylesterase